LRKARAESSGDMLPRPSDAYEISVVLRKPVVGPMRVAPEADCYIVATHVRYENCFVRLIGGALAS